ncbi:MAG: hypothetical protein N2C13_06565 [Chloroflexota bacterium]
MRHLLFLMVLITLVGCGQVDERLEPSITATRTPVQTATRVPKSSATITLTPTSSYTPYPTLTQFPVPTPFGWISYSESPNGEWFAWKVQNGNDIFLIVESMDGSKQWKEEFVLRPGWNVGPLSPVHWSKNGRYLYLVNSPRGDGGVCCIVLSVKRMDLQTGLIIDEIPLEAGMVFGYDFAALSDRLAYADGGKGFGASLVVRDLRKGNVTWHYVSFPEYAEYQAGDLNWSPDENKIVFLVSVEGPDVEYASFSIAFVDLVSGERKILVWRAPLITLGKWLDDVSVYVSLQDNEPPYEMHSYSLNVETGELTPIEE